MSGTSVSPCSDVYRGPSADSELEIKAVQNAILAKEGQWDFFLHYTVIPIYGNSLKLP